MLFRSDRKSTRLNSSHLVISYAVFCLKKTDSIVASKYFDKRRARFLQPSVRSTSQRLGKTTNPLTSLSVRLTIVTAMRLFFFNDTATTEIYSLSLHDALPI